MSGQATAKQALQVLSTRGYIAPTSIERKTLAMAFAGRGKVIYGRAFDAARVSGAKIDLTNLSDLGDRLEDVRLFEVKSTDRDLDTEFHGHFFSLSTAELLVAQSLRDQFGFLFVNVNSKEVLEMSLQDLLGRTKAIYPSWSVSF